MAKKQETIFKERILPKLRALPNAWVLKTQEMGRSGTPDILMCLCGVFVAIELKTDDGVVSPLQKYNLDKIADGGGIALIVSPSNMSETLIFLAHFAEKLRQFMPEILNEKPTIKRKPRNHEH